MSGTSNSFPPCTFVTVDAVVFGYLPDAGLSILLIKRLLEPYAGEWALPGGYVLPDESLDQAVYRELSEEAGLSINYLEQLYTFGAPHRDPRGRTVSVAYYALVNAAKHRPAGGSDATEAAWFSLNDLPELAFDHRDIIQKAIERLQAKVTYEPVGFELLEEEFPFSDVEKLYATLLRRPPERRNFKKKFLSLDLLIDTGNTRPTGVSGRPATLYKFHKQNYFQLKSSGLHFGIWG